VRGARVAVFLDAFDAFLRSAGNRAGLAQDIVCDRLRSGFAAAFLHGIGDWLEFFEGQSRRLQQDISRSFNILHFVREIHGGLLARTLFSLFRVAADRTDNDAAEDQIGRVFPCLRGSFKHVLS
jgi:hypothetical protein